MPIKNQFLRHYFDGGASAEKLPPPDAATKKFISDLRKLLYRYADGWISEEQCAITAGTAAAQWDIRIRNERAKSRPASPLDNLILPDSVRSGGV